VVAGFGSGGRQQGRLADPGLAPDDKSAAGPVAGPTGQITQSAEFTLTPEHAVRRGAGGLGGFQKRALLCLTSSHRGPLHALRCSVGQTPPGGPGRDRRPWLVKC